jgi:DNA gyrase subunit A
VATNPDEKAPVAKHYAKEIIDVDVEDEVAESFLAYSLSVITSRAIPDVRDGLKPVQRRILYSMHSLGARPTASYMKCARVIGDVIGKYHPHGDSACYEALVRLAQDFSLQTPLIDGQGNFGSLDDGAAAMRYCVVGTTRVQLEDGTTRRIDSLGDVAENSEIDVHVKLLDWRGEPVCASKLFHSGTHPTRRLTLSSGALLRGTFNHPVLCLEAPAGVPMLLWKLLSEIQPGDCVAVRPQPGIVSNREREPFRSLTDSASVPFIGEYLRDELGDSQELTNLLALLGTPEFAKVVDRISNAEVSAVLEPLLNTGLRFTTVLRCEDAEPAAVYSLRVDSEDHSFITNGIVSHNTECRMANAALDMLADLDEGTVDWSPNYDAKETEPDVLPARLPNLLVNGTTGIAVGMATNLAPHSPVEVLAAMRVLLKNPDATLDDLMAVLPGPDFPTGGIIVDAGGIREAYETGRGGFRIRGKATIESVSARRQGIVVTELPFNVGPERFIERVKALVSDGNLLGVSNIIDLSDRRHGLRVVVECKAGASAERTLVDLYRKSPLEEGFTINAVVLVGGQPQTLGLIALCQHWLTHRFEVLRRRSQWRIDKAAARAHILEGLLLALTSIDEVVATIRASADTAAARDALIARFQLSDIQADHILEMPLRRLTGLEVEKLTSELKELRLLISDLTALLGSVDLQRAAIDTEIVSVSAALDRPRRSPIVGADHIEAVEPASGEATTVEPCCVSLGVDGTLTRHALDATPATRPKLADVAVSVATGSVVYAIAADGSFDTVSMIDVPAFAAGSVPAGRATSVSPMSIIGDHDLTLGHLVIVTANGVVKRLDASTLPSRLPTSVIALRDSDVVVAAFSGPEEFDLVLVSSDGQVLRTPLSKIRPQGRTAGGVAGMRLNDGAHVVGAGLATPGAHVAVLSDAGGVKLTPVDDYPAKGRGGAGVRGVRLRGQETVILRALVAPGLRGVSGKKLVNVDSCAGKRDGVTTDPSAPVDGFAFTR